MNLPHSPAPWVLIKDIGHDALKGMMCIECNSGGRQHTVAIIPKILLPDEEIAANAKLIEAAPDMYRMLKKVVASGYLDAEILYLLNRLEEGTNHEQENRESA